MSMYPLHVYTNTTMSFKSIFFTYYINPIIVTQNHSQLRRNRTLSRQISSILDRKNDIIEVEGVFAMDNLALREPPRIERINGKIVMMSPRPRINHNRVISNINHLFQAYLWDKPCEVFSDGVDVHLDDKNWFIPDVMIVCNHDIIRPDAIHGAPDLVVEVLSPSTASNDRGPKMRSYAKAGVRECWIVSPLSRCVEVYLNHNGTFEFDEAFTDYTDEDLADMSDEDRAKVHMEIKVSLYDDLFVSVRDIFHKL